MMMHLYSFGVNILVQQPPNPLRSVQTLKILYSSWCDLILAQSDDLTITYHGTSLNPLQQSFIANLVYTQPVVFFGRTLDHGVRGFISYSNAKSSTGAVLTIFPSDQEIKDGKAEVEQAFLSKDAAHHVLDIHLTAKEIVLVCVRGQEGDGRGRVIEMASLDELRSLAPSLTGPKVCDFIPTQCVSNATTFTVLDAQGKIYTYALDMRYPKCLGRDHSSDPTGGEAQPIPYFSETTVRKIASGGYYTAAVTSDGELFIWGQSPPGTDDELSLLQTPIVDEDGDEDVFVRCVEIMIEGQVAAVTDVAVGWGHVLIAAEMKKDGEEVKRAVFAAGCNERDQLCLGTGLGVGGFVKEFTEVESLRGKRIQEMVCAGWSSHIIVDSERDDRE